MAHMSHKHHAYRRGWNKYNMGAHTVKKSEAHMRSCKSICPIPRTQKSIIYNLHTCGAPFRLTQPTQHYTLKLDTDRVAGPFTAHTNRIEQAKENEFGGAAVSSVIIFVSSRPLMVVLYPIPVPEPFDGCSIS